MLAPRQDRLRGPPPQPGTRPKPPPPCLPPPSEAEPESVGVGEAATELEPDQEDIQGVTLVDISEGEPEEEELEDDIPAITIDEPSSSAAAGLPQDRLRGPPAIPIPWSDDQWTITAVNRLVAAAHPDRDLHLTRVEDPYLWFIPTVPVQVIWNWLRDQTLIPPSDMPFRGDDSCREGRIVSPDPTQGRPCGQPTKQEAAPTKL